MARSLYGEPGYRSEVQFESERFLKPVIYKPNTLADLFENMGSHISDGGVYKVDIKFRDPKRYHTSTDSFKTCLSATRWLNNFSGQTSDILQITISKEVTS